MKMAEISKVFFSGGTFTSLNPRSLKKKQGFVELTPLVRFSLAIFSGKVWQNTPGRATGTSTESEPRGCRDRMFHVFFGFVFLFVKFVEFVGINIVMLIPD